MCTVVIILRLNPLVQYNYNTLAKFLYIAYCTYMRLIKSLFTEYCIIKTSSFTVDSLTKVIIAIITLV